MISKELLEILACPLCKSNIKVVGKDKLVCKKCKTVYPIENGIPNMLPQTRGTKTRLF